MRYLGIAAFPGGATKAFGSDFSKMWDIIFICDGCACVLLNGSQACKICIASNKAPVDRKKRSCGKLVALICFIAGSASGMLPSILAKQAGYKNPLPQHQKYFPCRLCLWGWEWYK